MDGNFTFKIGERVLDDFRNEWIILEKALRPADFLNREMYLVGKKGFWGEKRQWILQASLTRILPHNNAR